MFPGRGQIAVHLQARQNGIGDRPRLRLVAKQRELKGHGVAVGFHKMVDAAGERHQHGAIGRRQQTRVLFGHPPHAQAAGVEVEFKGLSADHFRQFTSRQAAHAVHLEQAILGHGVAFEEDGVLP